MCPARSRSQSPRTRARPHRWRACREPSRREPALIPGGGAPTQTTDPNPKAKKQKIYQSQKPKQPFLRPMRMDGGAATSREAASQSYTARSGRTHPLGIGGCGVRDDRRRLFRRERRLPLTPGTSSRPRGAVSIGAGGACVWPRARVTWHPAVSSPWAPERPRGSARVEARRRRPQARARVPAWWCWRRG